MARKRITRPVSDVSEDTARNLFLVYGKDAVEMTELRCRELEAAGDKGGLANWQEVLEHVRELAAANREGRGASH
jgi:hypothetical protein